MTEQDPPAAPPQRRNRLFLIGALTVAGLGLLFITAGGIGRNLVYYWGPSELHAAAPKPSARRFVWAASSPLVRSWRVRARVSSST